MNRNYLYLSIFTFTVGSLCILALYMGTFEYAEDTRSGPSDMILYVMMSLAGFLMFMFGYIPFTVYQKQRRERNDEQ